MSIRAAPIHSGISEGTAHVSEPIPCDGCGRPTPGYNTVSYGSPDQGYRTLCSRCFNAEVARLGGLETFEHVQFDPVVLTDAEGEAHEFHFRTCLFGTGVVPFR